MAFYFEMKIRLYLTLLLLGFTFRLFAQEPEITFTFEGIGDNREFSGSPSISQTILGARGAFEAGFLYDRHRLRAGLSRLFEFGNEHNQKVKPILYYQYADSLKSFQFGLFPRRNLVNFPLVMLTDTLNYYRPNIEGLHGELHGNWGYQNAFVDWTGRQSAVVRESFTAASSGEIGFGSFFVQNFILLNHLAHSKQRGEDEHVNDNFGYLLMTGLRQQNNPTWQGYLKAGILGSMFRERSVTDGFVSAQSLLAEGYIKTGNFGVRNTLHSGGSHIFLSGDPMYRIKNYNRTDAIWYFINHKNINGRFNVSFHAIEWEKVAFSQQLSIIYVLEY